MYKNKQIFKINVLKKLLTEPHSCVTLVPTTRLLALPPFFLNDLKSGVTYILNSILKKYDRILDGILIGYQNIKILMDENTGVIPMGVAETEVNISVEFYIFQPKIGSFLEGVINKKSNNHIGCLVHHYFNATILKPEDIEYDDWMCRDFNVTDKIIFKVKDLDFTGFLPYIEGIIDDDDLIDQIKFINRHNVKSKEMNFDMVNEDRNEVVLNEDKHEMEKSDDKKKILKVNEEEENMLENSNTFDESNLIENSSFTKRKKKKEKRKHEKETAGNVNTSKDKESRETAELEEYTTGDNVHSVDECNLPSKQTKNKFYDIEEDNKVKETKQSKKINEEEENIADNSNVHNTLQSNAVEDASHNKKKTKSGKVAEATKFRNVEQLRNSDNEKGGLGENVLNLEESKMEENSFHSNKKKKKKDKKREKMTIDVEVPNSSEIEKSSKNVKHEENGEGTHNVEESNMEGNASHSKKKKDKKREKATEAERLKNTNEQEESQLSENALISAEGNLKEKKKKKRDKTKNDKEAEEKSSIPNGLDNSQFESDEGLILGKKTKKKRKRDEDADDGDNHPSHHPKKKKKTVNTSEMVVEKLIEKYTSSEKKEASFEGLENAKEAIESPPQKENAFDDNIFCSTQLGRVEDSSKMKISFCSPILPEPLLKKKKKDKMKVAEPTTTTPMHNVDNKDDSNVKKHKGKKRKREDVEADDATTTPKKLKNGSMYDCVYSPSPKKMKEDRSLFSDSDSNSKSSPRKGKEVNGEISGTEKESESVIDKRQLKSQDLLNEFRKEESNRLGRESEMTNEESNRESKENKSQSRVEKEEEKSSNDLLYLKLLQDAKSLINLSKETPKRTKKEKSKKDKKNNSEAQSDRENVRDELTIGNYKEKEETSGKAAKNTTSSYQENKSESHSNDKSNSKQAKTKVKDKHAKNNRDSAVVSENILNKQNDKEKTKETKKETSMSSVRESTSEHESLSVDKTEKKNKCGSKKGKDKKSVKSSDSESLSERDILLKSLIEDRKMFLKLS